MGLRPNLEEIVREAKIYGDRHVWSQADPKRRGGPEPDGSLRARDLFTYALVICEANEDLDRLKTLFTLVRRMQDRDGDIRWAWDPKIAVINGVEFCMRGAALLLQRHPERIPPNARDILDIVLKDAAQACLRHRVPASYTNIALMNVMNLVLIGESLNRPEVAEEGYQRLEGFFDYTSACGIHEYCSPTYTGISLYCLGLIEMYCKRKQGQEQARALLRFFWTDVALNRLSSSGRLGGAYSRKLGTYLQKEAFKGVFLNEVLCTNGWLSKSLGEHLNVLYPALVRWQPPDDLLRLSDEFPRLVRERWGKEENQTRTHYVCEDISLSSASSGYDYPPNEDLPLTVDLSSSLRCYFLPDTEGDPYGENDTHCAPLLWAAAQRRSDALGLVLYRPAERRSLESHFVMPWPVDEVWVGGRPADMARTGSALLKPGESLALREGTAAVGVRVVWESTRRGQPAPAVFHYEKIQAEYPATSQNLAMRLTVQHHFEWGGAGEKGPLTVSGAAFWVRIGSGLKTDGDFEGWREMFAASRADEPEIYWDEAGLQLRRLRLAVEGVEGPLSVAVSFRGENDPVARIDPSPTQALLELNGTEIGRPILNALGSG